LFLTQAEVCVELTPRFLAELLDVVVKPADHPLLDSLFVQVEHRHVVFTRHLHGSIRTAFYQTLLPFGLGVEDAELGGQFQTTAQYLHWISGVQENPATTQSIPRPACRKSKLA